MKGIIIEHAKSVFWPIPKNACTSFKIHLMHVLKVPNNNPHKANFPLTTMPIDGYENWSVVRNPYSRFYSLWANKIAPGHFVHPKFMKEIDMNVFGGAIKNGIKIKSGMSFDAFTKNILNNDCPVNIHWELQSRQMPLITKTFKIEDNEILKYFLGVFNKSNSDNWKNVYSNTKTYELVKNYYERDFEKFGYEKAIY